MEVHFIAVWRLDESAILPRHEPDDPPVRPFVAVLHVAMHAADVIPSPHRAA